MIRNWLGMIGSVYLQVDAQGRHPLQLIDEEVDPERLGERGIRGRLELHLASHRQPGSHQVLFVNHDRINGHQTLQIELPRTKQFQEPFPRYLQVLKLFFP